MGRADARAAKARKVKDTLDILRDRDRKLSSFDQLIPPDSKTSPPRILRSNISSYHLPPCPPRAPHAPLPPSRKQIRKAERMEKRASGIEERVRLLRIEFDSVFDLTHIGSDIGTDKFRVDNELFTTQNDEQSFNVWISLGFRGYLEQTTGQHKILTLQCLRNPPTFQFFVYRVLQNPLQIMGLKEKDIEISGYEVLFPADFVHRGVTIQAGELVLTRSSNILVGWAELAVKHHSTPEIVVRVVKSDGNLFDPTFRTQREILLKTIEPSDAIELGTQKSPDELKATSIKSRWQKRQERRETRLEQKETQADARREEKAQKARLKFDTFLIERLLARSHLSGNEKDRKVTRASSLPDVALQRSAGTEHTESQVEDVEQGGVDFDMDE